MKRQYHCGRTTHIFLYEFIVSAPQLQGQLKFLEIGPCRRRTQLSQREPVKCVSIISEDVFFFAFQRHIAYGCGALGCHCIPDDTFLGHLCTHLNFDPQFCRVFLRSFVLDITFRSSKKPNRDALDRSFF